MNCQNSQKGEKKYVAQHFHALNLCEIFSSNKLLQKHKNKSTNNIVLMDLATDFLFRFLEGISQRSVI